MKISQPWIAFVLFAIFCSQIIIYQNYRIQILSDVVEINKKARQLDQDQIRDLMFEIQSVKSQNQSIAMTNFVAGVVDSINKKDYYSEIWHAGFSQGMQNQFDIDESKKFAILKDKIKE